MTLVDGFHFATFSEHLLCARLWQGLVRAVGMDMRGGHRVAEGRPEGAGGARVPQAPEEVAMAATAARSYGVKPPDPRPPPSHAKATPDPQAPTARASETLKRGAIWRVPTSPDDAERPQHPGPPCTPVPPAPPADRGSSATLGCSSPQACVLPGGGLTVGPKSCTSQGQGRLWLHKPVTKPGQTGDYRTPRGHHPGQGEAQAMAPRGRGSRCAGGRGFQDELLHPKHQPPSPRRQTRGFAGTGFSWGTMRNFLARAVT